MLDVISIINGILSALEKAAKVPGAARDVVGGRGRERLTDARTFIQEASLLIDKFKDSVEAILDFLDSVTNQYELTNRIPELTRLNRRLFEIASEMRVLTLSIEARLPKQAASDLRRITDGCIQILAIEVFAAELVPAAALPLIPKSGLDPLAYEPYVWTDERLPKTIALLTGPPDALTKAKDTFNTLIVSVNDGKERLAVALREVK